MGQGRGFQFRQVGDSQFLEEHLGLFRPHALHCHEFVQVNGQLLPEFLVILNFPGIEIFFDLQGDALAHAGNTLQGLKTALIIDILDAVLEILQRDGGLLIGIGLEADAVHLQILGNLIEDFGNLPVFHGSYS